MTDTSNTTEAERWDAGFHGHGRGVVVSNDGHGNFSERPMTIAEKHSQNLGTQHRRWG